MYKLFSNCLITQGINRSIICDVQRNRFFLIPNSMVNLFDSKKIIRFSDLISNEDSATVEILLEYKTFLENNNLVFSIKQSEIELFPEISLDFNFPSHISNILIDIKNIELDWTKIISELNNLNCLHIQLRFYKIINKDELYNILQNFSNSLIHSIDIILEYQDALFNNLSTLNNLINEFPKVRTITFYNAPQNEIIINPKDGLGGIRIIKEIINNELACGLVAPDFFTINIPHYTESLHHNTCLNRKIAIDVDGNIKNCPSMKENFGNIRDTTLVEAINKPGFKKYWNIKKDEITKCKDCEFRHVCTDCRAYIDNPEDMYSAPLKCGYNPYTCEWEEWSTNPLKQKAIDYYGMKEILTSKK